MTRQPTRRSRTPANSDLIAFARQLPLFANLQELDLQQIAHGLTPRRLAKGDYLYVLGQAADSAYFVESGMLDVLNTLPGGGEVQIAELGPLSVIGEMSLIESGTRTASVRARTDVVGYAMHQDYFQSSITQLNPTAFKVLRHLMAIMCERLRVLFGRIVLASENVSEFGAQALDTGGHALSNGIQPGACSFEYRKFLPILPFFKRFQLHEVDALAEDMEVLEVPRGTVVFREGDPPDACYVVVRGAVEISLSRGGCRYKLIVLGPGRMCGDSALVDKGTHIADCVAREDAVILEFKADAFGDLIEGDTWEALKFQLAICENQIVDLAKSNKHLSRLVSLAAIHGEEAALPAMDMDMAFDDQPDAMRPVAQL